MKVRLLALAGLIVVLAACGDSDRTEATATTSSDRSVAGAPEGDVAAIDACAKAIATGPADEKWTLVAAFSTTEGTVAQWKQTREPGQPKQSFTAEQLASETPVSVCYVDGNFPDRRAPGADAPTPPLTRAIIQVDQQGQIHGDRVGYVELLPVRRPAADAEPLNLETAPGFTVPASD